MKLLHCNIPKGKRNSDWKRNQISNCNFFYFFAESTPILTNLFGVLTPVILAIRSRCRDSATELNKCI